MPPMCGLSRKAHALLHQHCFGVGVKSRVKEIKDAIRSHIFSANETQAIVKIDFITSQLFAEIMFAGGGGQLFARIVHFYSIR